MTRHILLVDDEPNFLKALVRQFYPHRQEWHVATAGSGAEALRWLGEQPVDLLVTDILMPDKDGIETIMEIRREHPSVKIVAMSGGGRQVGKEPLSYARLLGAHATLEKPFAFSDLRDTIRTLLEAGADTA